MLHIAISLNAPDTQVLFESCIATVKFIASFEGINYDSSEVCVNHYTSTKASGYA